MKLSHISRIPGVVWLAAAGVAALVFWPSPAAGQAPPPPQPQPEPFPVPPGPAPGPDPRELSIQIGDSVLVPLLALYPTGAPFPIDPNIPLDEAVDAVRVLVQEVRPADRMLRGTVTAYHYGGPASDGWKIVPIAAPTPFFPASVVSQKLLTTR